MPTLLWAKASRRLPSRRSVLRCTYSSLSNLRTDVIAKNIAIRPIGGSAAGFVVHQSITQAQLAAGSAAALDVSRAEGRRGLEGGGCSFDRSLFPRLREPAGDSA